jgi:PKD repeat protein
MGTKYSLISWRGICTAFAVTGFLLLGSMESASAAISISSATWSSSNQRLSTSGSGAQRRSTITITYAGDNVPIGTTQASNRGSWSATFNNLNPVPCTIRTSDGSTSATRAVSNAPTNCSNNGTVNTPPLANAGGPYIGTVGAAVTFNGSGSSDAGGSIVSYAWNFGDGSTGTGVGPTHTYTAAGSFTVTLTVTDNGGLTNTATTTATITGGVTARGDTYATPVGTTLNVAASRISGVLYNDFGGTGALTAQLVSGPANGTLTLNSNGSFTYTPNASLSDNNNDSFTYRARDSQGKLSAVTKVNINILSKQADFKIMMNYELGMHCTGFEFAYCCVLPPYNSILAQVVKPESGSGTSRSFPRLLSGDPNNTDGLGRPTVVRDYDRSGTIRKYFLEYYHDAQPRREGQGKAQTSTLISAVEGNSLFYTSTVYDSADIPVDQDPNKPGNQGPLAYGPYEGAYGVVQGDGDFNDPTDNYANGWLNHFYIYADLEGSNPANTSLEKNKLRLGVTGHVAYPADVGAALQPMGPTGSAAGFDNVLTFSGDTGTVVYTQMKVLENLPIMLTSPKIWEALGLPLTPFEDSVDFFGDPGLVNEDSIRPYVAMKARLHVASCDANGQNCTQGAAVIGSNGKPVIGHGTAPIDIPNCERCHSVPATTSGQPNLNSPSYVRRPGGPEPFAFPHSGSHVGQSLQAVTDAEKSFWDAYYGIVAGVDSDWYSRLKGAAINMLSLHDFDNGTSFTSNWPNGAISLPPAKAAFMQNTRLGKESVICQKCHADNVIAVVKSAYKDQAQTQLIKPITEAIHHRHREVSEGGSINFADAAGRSGGCQGCHPAHRSDGVMDGYPITYGGENAQATSDNRLASGGCFVGRDVHSNPMKDVDGAETPSHLNAVGTWLADAVFHNQDGKAGVAGNDTRGLWCTNCHSQLGQELWRTEDCNNLITGDCINNPRGQPTLADVASAVGVSEEQAIAWLDPTNTNSLGDFTHAIWDPAISDANLATIEVDAGGNPVVTADGDGDISVNILSFCTTADCVNRINANKGNQSAWRYPANPFINSAANHAAAVPFAAATDGRDHWLSAGEPHCADCHAAPFVEQSGNINAYPPFNYPAKASLMRYSKGHQGVSCQGCHESIHGLYPVTPTIDSTSYAQAAALNADGSHGPLKCGTCHTTNSAGVPSWLQSSSRWTGGQVTGNFDGAVGWAHTFTEDASVLNGVCLNCHGVQGSNWSAIASSDPEGTWLRHAMDGRTSREMMDKAQIEQLGHVYGDPAYQNTRTTVCEGCHGDEWSSVSCSGENATEWRQHLTQGRVSQSIWEYVTKQRTGGTCGW